MKSDPSELEAHAFALRLHNGQFRKWTGGPYIEHPREVVRYLQYTDLAHNSTVICAAYLHDVVEDCGVTVDDINIKFGKEVARIVDHLSDTLTHEAGNRAFRKQVQLERLKNSCSSTQSIKYADLLSNWPSIRDNDPAFATVYRAEAMALVNAMDQGNMILRRLLLLELGAK